MHNPKTWGKLDEAPMKLLDPIGMNPIGWKKYVSCCLTKKQVAFGPSCAVFLLKAIEGSFDPYLYCSTYRTIVYPQNCMIPDPKMRPSLLWLQDATGMDPFGVHATRRRRSLFPLTVWNLCDLRGCAIHDPPGLYRCLANVRRTRQR